MEGDGGRVGVLEHHLVVGAARQDLGDDVAEPGEHLVAGGVEDDPVEGDVVVEVALQLLAARGGDHAEGAFGELGALLGGGVAGGEAGGDRFDRRAQDGEGAQLARAVGAGQAPADDLGVVDVPLASVGRTVTPTRRRDSTRCMDSRTRTTSRITVRETSKRWASSSVRSTLPGGYSPAVIAGPEGVQHMCSAAPGPVWSWGQAYGAALGNKKYDVICHRLLNKSYLMGFSSATDRCRRRQRETARHR